MCQPSTLGPFVILCDAFGPEAGTTRPTFDGVAPLQAGCYSGAAASALRNPGPTDAPPAAVPEPEPEKPRYLLKRSPLAPTEAHVLSDPSVVVIEE